MRGIRIWLPSLQLVIAVSLTTTNLLKPNVIANPSWRAPDKQLCAAINAPATLIKSIILLPFNPWFLHHPIADFLLETVAYFALIVLLWYLVALAISGMHAGRIGWVLSTNISVRRTVDVGLMLFGIAVGVFGELVRRQPAGPYGINYWNFMSVPYFVWALVLVGFHSRDLWMSFVVANLPRST